MAGGLRSSPILQHEMADRAANTGSRRAVEENETIRAKLVDQHISMLNYPDPLKPRAQLKIYPPGVTQEMEAKWLHILQQTKG